MENNAANYWKEVKVIGEWELPEYIKNGYNILHSYHKKRYSSNQSYHANGSSYTQYYESSEPEVKFVVGRSVIAEKLFTG